MFKKGDILTPYENRKTSNGIILPQGMQVEVLASGKTISWDSKVSVPVKIISNHSTRRSSGYISRATGVFNNKTYSMSSSYGHKFGKGSTLIIFADGFKRISTPSGDNVTSHVPTSSFKGNESSKNIKRSTLICLMS